MGKPISLDDPEYGNDCALFADPTKTPIKMYVYFWEIEACPFHAIPPNLHLFSCYQDEVNACIWENVPGSYGWQVKVHIGPPGVITLVTLHDSGGNPYFWGSLAGPPIEHDVFNNDQVMCVGGARGIKGNALVFWAEAAVKLIGDFVLPTDSQILMEFFVTADHKPVYKFCFPKYGMNIKFLMSP